MRDQKKRVPPDAASLTRATFAKPSKKPQQPIEPAGASMRSVSGPWGDPGGHNRSVRIQRNSPMRCAAFVPDGIDIVTLASDAEKCDGLDRAEFFMTRLQIWQLTTGRFGQGQDSFRHSWVCQWETLDETMKGCLRSRARRLTLHLRCGIV